MSPTSSEPTRRFRSAPYVLTGLVLLLVSLGFVPRVREHFAEEWQMARYNAGAGGYDTQVRFWGKVVDQNGKPVEGAAIAAFVTTLRMIKVKGGYREYAHSSLQMGLAKSKPRFGLGAI